MPENLDALFNEQKPKANTQQQAFNADEYKNRKQTERESVFALVSDTAERMKSSGELFQTYLDVQARFDRFSVSNAILIAAQRPEATRLHDFDTWKDAGVSVNKGETAISILEPGREFEREDGSTGVSYNVKKVFDVSQTNSKEHNTPTIMRDERLILKSLISNAPCAMTISDKIAPTANAIYSPAEKTIYIRAGMDAPDIFRALTQELAHAHMDKGGGYSRSEHQGVAHFASYILCKRYGIADNLYDFSKMPAQYASMDVKAFRAELSKIRDVAGEISRDMNRFLEAPDRAKIERSDDAR